MTGLVESALRASALACVVGVALALLRVRSAAVRACVWTMVLGAAWLIPGFGRLASMSPWSMAIVVPPAQSIVVATEDPPPTDRVTTTAAVPERDAVVTTAPAIVLPDPGRLARARPWALALLYLIGCSALVARLVIGWIEAAHLRRRTTPVDDGALRHRLRRHATALGLTHSPRVVESCDVHVPMILGVVRPIVVLPASWRGWPSSRLDAVLLHELAHVARWDPVTQRVSLAYRVVYWFSPFSWWLHARLVALGEQACDDAVLASGLDQVSYAETLLAFFAVIRDGADRATWRIAMASGASAVRRVHRVLEWREAQARHITWSIVAGIVIAVMSTAALTAAARPEFVRFHLSGLPLPPDAPALADALPIKAWPGTIPVAMPETSTGATLTQRSIRIDAGTAAASTVAAPAGARQDSQQRGYYYRPVSPTADLSDRQFIVLLFDLGALPGDDLKQAVYTARRYVDDMWTRADVGLDVHHLAAVVTIGSTMQALQDFTWDRALIDTALSNISAPPTLPASAIALRGATTVCENVSRARATPSMFAGSGILERLQQIGTSMAPLMDTKAVLFFNNGVARSLQSAADLATLANACTQPNMMFRVVNAFTFLLTPPAVVPVGVSLSVVPHQLGCPVTILSSNSTLDFGYASVTIRNDSTKTIRSLTLAALVRPKDPALPTPQIFARAGPSAMIPPGGVLDIASELIDASTLRSLALKGATAEIGLVAIEFTDGSNWTYDLKARGQFEIGGAPGR